LSGSLNCAIDGFTGIALATTATATTATTATATTATATTSTSAAPITSNKHNTSPHILEYLLTLYAIVEYW